MITTDWVSAKSYIVGEQFFYTLNKSIEKYTKVHRLNISSSIVSDRVMKKLNHSWRGKNKTTDVLSFPYNEDKGLVVEKSDYDGEVIISFEQAKRQSGVNSLRTELATLYIHGVLHIIGYDHVTRVQHKEMYGIQEKILEYWKKIYGSKKHNK